MSLFDEAKNPMRSVKRIGNKVPKNALYFSGIMLTCVEPHASYPKGKPATHLHGSHSPEPCCGEHQDCFDSGE